jgi:hypothetical protein
VTQQTMNPPERVTFVHGYDDDAAPRTTAPASRAEERFAVVIDSDSPESVDAVFKFALYEALVLDPRGSLGANRMAFRFDGGFACEGIAVAVAKITAEPSEDREPARLVEVFFGDVRAAVVETESWVYCGGPPTYHDSYTFVFYAERHLVERIAAACREAARVHRVEVADVIGRRF